MGDLVKFLEALSNPMLAACAIFIAKSINDLNLKIAIIIERVDSHEKRLTRLEE